MPYKVNTVRARNRLVETIPDECKGVGQRRAIPNAPLQKYRRYSPPLLVIGDYRGCNYGANVNTLIKQFGFSEELANKLYNAYNTAFPGIKHYKDYVAKILEHQNYITNLFGRRYYDASSHKCCNYLIQGSGADYLKLKLIEIDKFLEPYKSRIVCTIHDEIVYEIYDGEEFLIPQIKAIMENLEGTYVPMVSEVEITHTTWDEKE